MDRTIGVRTPESIAFTYELAGLGSRFLALCLDTIAQFLLAIALFWGIAALSHGVSLSTIAHVSQSVIEALFVAMLFGIFFGYYIVFEAAWHGQTPGKRLLGIRTVRDGGYPLDFMGSLLRNVVRIAEAALGLYALSAVVMLASNENKRLGDYAAGTIVVRDARMVLPAFRGDPATCAARFSVEERALAARFVERRNALEGENRARLARQIADRLRAHADPAWAKLDDETLIERASAS